MRRLDLQPRKKLRNPARHLRSLEKWSCSFAEFFPCRTIARKGLWYEKIPIFEKAVSTPHTRCETQKQCAQLMIDAAERLRDSRPPGEKIAGIYTFLTLPDMFDSFVEVAFEANPHLFFNRSGRAGREGDAHYWREYFDIDSGLFHDLDLRIPVGFNVRGTGLRIFDADWMQEPVEMEEWSVGEIPN